MIIQALISIAYNRKNKPKKPEINKNQELAGKVYDFVANKELEFTQKILPEMNRCLDEKELSKAYEKFLDVHLEIESLRTDTKRGIKKLEEIPEQEREKLVPLALRNARGFNESLKLSEIVMHWHVTQLMNSKESTK